MEDLKYLLPVVPLRDAVVFPKLVMPLYIGRKISVSAFNAALTADKKIIFATQKDNSSKIDIKNFYKVGVIARMVQSIKLPDGTEKVLVEGVQRVRIIDFVTNNYIQALYKPIEYVDHNAQSEDKLKILKKAVLKHLGSFATFGKAIPKDVMLNINSIKNFDELLFNLLQFVDISLKEKIEFIDNVSLVNSYEKLLFLMSKEEELLIIENEIKNKVKKQMEKSQREYYLNEQIKAIQSELGSNKGDVDDFQELRASIKKAKMPKVVEKKAIKELDKLRMMPFMSSESTVSRSYIDTLISIPWHKQSRVNLDLVKASKMLNEDHFGLKKVKDRIIEYLAVNSRSKKKGTKGPILCFVGPPGVGKSSLAISIARATGREYVRISLGGMRDEAEIKGHRRTYIGSMPGKIIQAMRKAKTVNPLILLDEVDKLGADWRGDPSSALLEVLDPVQNKNFTDHYLGLEYDLSKVMFIATANSYDIQGPLLDRMEVINLSSYTQEEKVAIAQEYLIAKQERENNIKKGEVKISEEALLDIIRYYVREAGVRNLEREIGKIMRKSLKHIINTKDKSVHIRKNNLTKFLGHKVFQRTSIEDKSQVGVVNGLAWTSVGGELLNIESVLVPGKGKFTNTGKLGDVMKESIIAAEYYIKSNAPNLGLDAKIFKQRDVHVHVPEGATPKDGPSAGVTMVTAMVSAIADIPVRCDVAMTGEVTLRGRILKIGGLKEKLLAAFRAGIKTVLIPMENKLDLADMDTKILSKMKIIAVDNVAKVLEIALAEPIKPIKWDKAVYGNPKHRNFDHKISKSVELH